jgi:Ala-tRNA(Pro) deacylase
VPVSKFKEYLDSHKIKYVSLAHSTAYTAQEIAALTHTPGRELAKIVIVKLDDALAMAVLPASFQVDLEQLKTAAGAGSARLAVEADFRGRFPDCETGAMPPFGNLYGMVVYVDENLTRDHEIAFNACCHHELVRLAYADYERLVKPKVARFATRRVGTTAA